MTPYLSTVYIRHHLSECVDIKLWIFYTQWGPAACGMGRPKFMAILPKTNTSENKNHLEVETSQKSH